MSKWNISLIKNTYWKVKQRYINLEPIGRGAYGSVVSAFDTVLQENVAIKKLTRPFLTLLDAKKTLREIKLLKHVNQGNVVLALDIFTPNESVQELEELYIVTEFMDYDLSQVLRSNHVLDNDAIKLIVYQIMRGLKYLHSCGIIHRDFKPNNLVVNQNVDLKIIDLGLARAETDAMTEYVVTRWYRAPELLFKWTNYTKAVDIWSVGCIIVELFTRKPVFAINRNLDIPILNQTEQMLKIFEVCGFPDDELFDKISTNVKYYLLSQSEKPNRVDFQTYFNEINDPLAIDLIDKMFQLDPDKRITCEQALEHPYFSEYHDPNDEPTGLLFDSSFENETHTLAEYKEMVYNEIQTFTKPVAQNHS